MQNACYALALIAIWNLWCVNWVFFHSRRLCGWKERPNQKSWLHVNKSHIHHHMRCVNGILTTLKYVYRWMKPTHGSCSGHIELNTWYGSVCALIVLDHLLMVSMFDTEENVHFMQILLHIISHIMDLIWMVQISIFLRCTSLACWKIN